MGGDQLALLEQRIQKAIRLIEELKGREKKFAEEKKLLEDKIKELNGELESKNDLIDELKRSQRFLKEKIEVILDKLESIEIFENTTDFELPITDDKESDIEESFSETKIIEDDNVVDLEELNEHNDQKEEKSSVNGTESDLEPRAKNNNGNKASTIISEKVVNDTKETEIEKVSGEQTQVSTETLSSETPELDDRPSTEPGMLDENLNKKDKGLEKDLEEDLKIIDGGKSLFDEENKSTENQISKSNESNESNEEKTGEGFLFNTRMADNKLKTEDGWFKNNPFI